jgi:hypothetical protein
MQEKLGHLKCQDGLLSLPHLSLNNYYAGGPTLNPQG